MPTKKRKNYQNMCSGKAQTTPLLGIWQGSERANKKLAILTRN